MKKLQLAPATKKRKIHDISELCVICEKDVTGKKTYGTDNGRKKLTEASNYCEDFEFIKKLNKDFFYHLECYKKYCLKANRAHKKDGSVEIEKASTSKSEDSDDIRRRQSTRQKRDGELCYL